MRGEQQLPNLPVPERPKNPACDWCGERPASEYEVEPPIMTTKTQRGPDGELHKVRMMKRRAIVAYACKSHAERFDRQKAQRAYYGKVA